MPDETLRGRPVLVFGASGALGHGVTAAFAAAGASVIGIDKFEPHDDRKLPGVSYRTADVMDDADVAAVFAAGPVPWAVINTVGGFAPSRPLAELDRAELVSQFNLNLLTATLITKHALAALQAAGQGRLVHTSSRAALITRGSGFAYSVSKLGVLHLVSMAADEVRGTGVTVNCVVPSIIDTPANRAALPDANHDAWPKIPDIAESYLYLAAPGSGLVNGAAIPV
jgi:NAD(P)-dependent dehydrogenase (short-subunit alcohol dehydrogenase family)